MPAPAITHATDPAAAPSARRAPSLPLEDRRAMILDAAIPLIVLHGRDVTTKQIADAAGIAEGTIFRAFADKDALLEGALARFMDPAPLHTALRAIDPQQPFESRVRAIVSILLERMTGVMGMMGAVGVKPKHPHRGGRDEFYVMIAEALAPDAERLRMEPSAAARIIRLVAFAAAIESVHAEETVQVDGLVDFIINGIAKPAPTGKSRK